ncbi:probable multidrug resistance-associated protein lethal(2)03659 [Chironomus tepperi]|uniref:probable multidrug resistance-associated protein lethal(2)03659 n=1 Tax=Chironomus tepperi TaxID=113505 RepID=UPI00391EEE1E
MESLTKRKQLQRCPREDANILSYVTFAWAFPMFLKGRKQAINEENLFEPLDEQVASKLSSNIEISWNKEKENSKKKNKNPWLVNALADVFGWEVLGQGLFLLFIECGIKILPPIFLSQIIKYHENSDQNSISIMYWSTFGITFCILLNVIIMHAFNLSNLNLGLKMRIAVSAMIYNKCLRLSKTALGSISLGRIVNMLSSDVGRFDSTAFGIHYLWVGPIQTVVVTALIYNEIGVSAFGGVILLLLMIPFQLFLGKTTAKLRMKTATRTDRRIKLMNEIIQGIQVIKMYAWEKPMRAVVAATRLKEIQMIRFVSWIKGITLSLMVFSSRISIFTSLVMYALLQNVLTAQKAFVVTAYYNVLRQTMVIMYPLAINNVAECRVAIQRIENLLFINDDEDNKLNRKDTGKTNVLIEDVSAKWKGESDDLTLSDINIKFKVPSVTTFIGKVGSGKSSVLQAILGELPITKGKIEVNGKVSYAAQEPWLFSGSVRQNILFGLPMDKTRYREVVKVCSLTRDFEIWPDGDKTIVGERGMSLSGGQKARINLARAIYRQADIYLLDDPLSAVDSHVGRHLFDNCIKNFLKDKLVILVTHQLQYLQGVDQIILLEDGKIQATGSFENLKNSGLDFANLLPEQENVEEDDESENGDISEDTRLLKKQESTISKKSEQEDEKVDKKKMDMKEKRAEGSIEWNVYGKYFQATGGYLIITFIMTFFALAQVIASISDYFLSYWVSKESARNIELDAAANKTSLTQTIVSSIFGTEDYDRNYDIYIYSGLIVATVLLTLGRSFLFFNVAMRASRQLHDAMYSGITRATMFFFHNNPSGRILNRFSKDMGQIDEALPMTMIDFFQLLFSLLGTIGVLIAVNQYYLIPTFILFAIFYMIRKVYIKISLDIKRLNSTTSSSVFSYLSETLNGLSTIRAFKVENNLKEEFYHHIDINTSSHYIWLAMTRTFAFILDICCFVYIAIVIISFLFTENSSSGHVGLAITQALGLTGIVQLGMRQSALLENMMTAVERVVEYQSVDPEPSHESPENKKPPKDWPKAGEIKFDKLSLSYHPSMEDKVLKELEFVIQPNEKIGIVGRTGAGKSSIINALFRLSYLDGSIYIDLRETQEMGLHDLRSKISIIPQEPVLFSGTMRYNLDPFDEYNDDKLWMALEEVKLKELIKDMPSGLNTKITEGGTNFSVGQRQLVCLARAILRENKILVMDEATANVDPQTDGLIQKTIRQKFAECTVLTIAHRLNTVIDSDRILVMDSGRCVEFGTPHELLSKINEPRIFYNMLKETGRTNFEYLCQKAHENFYQKTFK